MYINWFGLKPVSVLSLVCIRAVKGQVGSLAGSDLGGVYYMFQSFIYISILFIAHPTFLHTLSSTPSTHLLTLSMSLPLPSPPSTHPPTPSTSLYTPSSHHLCTPSSPQTHSTTQVCGMSSDIWTGAAPLCQFSKGIPLLSCDLYCKLLNWIMWLCAISVGEYLLRNECFSRKDGNKGALSLSRRCVV